MYTLYCTNTPLSHPPCILCGGLNHRKLYRWEVKNDWNPSNIPLTAWVCEECGLASLFPTPRPDQIPDAGDWWSSRRTRPRRRRSFKIRWERLRTTIFGSPAARLLRATRRAVGGGRLLDIGCGDGRLLTEAIGYFDCVGVEPSPLAAHTARAAGFQVIENTFENAVFQSESFDVVLMDSIIEHVADPMDILTKVNSILRMGGIVVLRTPKFGGPSCRIHGQAWNGFRHGYHNFFFSATTLSACLQRTGFDVLKRPRRNRWLDDILILWGRKSKATKITNRCPPSQHRPTPLPAAIAASK